MKKIPTIYLRDFDNNPKYVTATITPECAWVFKGEGVAVRKFDGTCIMLDEYGWWARREVKPGKDRPKHFVELHHDPVTDKRIGWVPVKDSPFYEFFREAWENKLGRRWKHGTYELCGPKINKNPERMPTHTLVCHADAGVLNPGYRNWESLRNYLHAHPYEGIIFRHPGGRLAKIKTKDFPKETQCLNTPT